MSELISNSYQIIKIINDNEHLFDGHAEVSEKNLIETPSLGQERLQSQKWYSRRCHHMRPSS